MRTLTLALFVTLSFMSFHAQAGDVVEHDATTFDHLQEVAQPEALPAPVMPPATLDLPPQEGQSAIGEAGTMQAAVALIASALVALFLGLARLTPLGRLVGDAGTISNRALPLVCLLLGIVVAIVNAWWLQVPIRSAEGWGLLQDGIGVGLGAIGVRSLVRTTVRGK